MILTDGKVDLELPEFYEDIAIHIKNVEK